MPLMAEPKFLARSRPTAGVGYRGNIPEPVWDILAAIWTLPVTVSSNLARENSEWIAFAASMGWISTITPDGTVHTRSWHLTKEGLVALETSTPKT